MRSFLVTGGAGFIGSHIAEALVRRGDRVRVLDNLSSGFLANLDGFHDRIEFIEGDVTDARRRGPGGGRRRLHLPRGRPGVGAGQRRAAAGEPRRLRHRHGDAAGRGPAGRHAAGRLCRLERRLWRPANQQRSAKPTCPPRFALCRGQGWPASSIAKRFGRPTGWRRWRSAISTSSARGRTRTSQYSAVIPIFITAMLAGRQPVIFGDGRQSRDFSFVGNVVHANLLAADAAGVAGRTINAADGRSIDLLQLIEILNRLLGLKVAPRFAPPRAGDVRESQADISLARRLLGYEPQIDFETGLRQSIDYYRMIARQ